MTDPITLAGSILHQQLVGDYLAHDSDEARLEWLMERPFLHKPVPVSERHPSQRVPGCLSGLWLTVEEDQELLHFGSHSDSPMVQGITSFLCDLHSRRSADEIISLDKQLSLILGLERLLSMTRKRAVSSVMNFILWHARNRSAQTPPASEAV